MEKKSVKKSVGSKSKVVSLTSNKTSGDKEKDEKVRKKFLPVGSVVLLKNGSKKLMITGFCVVNPKNKNKMWDYCGCLYPEGIVSSSEIFLFDHNQIKTIYHLGYENE